MMRRAGPITVYEAVTSDTTSALPDPSVLHMTGAEFVATEPYSAGIAPQVVALPVAGGLTRLAVVFPTEGRHTFLTLDRQGRIVQETLTDAKHLTRRHFVYQGEVAPG